MVQLITRCCCFFFFNDTATTEIYTLSLHDALPICQGVTGHILLQLLELRLDNIVYRAGWAATRPQARQFVSHGHIKVNGRRVNIASFRARVGDVIELRDKSREMVTVRWNLDVLDRAAPAWLEAGDGGQQVTVRELPSRDQIDIPVREQLIIELYSK